MILQIVIGGGMLLGVSGLRPRRKSALMRKRALSMHRKSDPLPRSVREFDRRYQALFQTSLDPIFGAARQLQLEELQIEVGEEEKGINRRLGLAVANVGLAALGSAYLPALLFVSAAGAVYVSRPLLQDVHAALVVERRLTYSSVAALSLVSTLAAGYFVTTNLIVLLIILTKKIIYRTENYSRKSISEIFQRQNAAPVWVLIDGVEVQTSLDGVEVGDIVVVGAGQTIPIDGVVVSGFAAIDQHTLTGEAQPAHKGVGEAVFASTLVLRGRIRIQVSKTGQETLSARILQIMERTSGYHLSFESKGRNFADRAALPVLAAAALAWPTVGIGGAVAVLSGGFGSILKLSAPLSMLNFLNIASRHGVLIKDGRSLEVLDQIDTIVFDKTGTLTLVQPRVAEIHAWDELSEDELLRLMASAEQRQSHPIARALLAEAARRELTLLPLAGIDCEVGYGMRADTAEGVLRVGSEQFLRLEGVAIPAEVVVRQALCHDQGHSLVMLAVGDRFAGAVELAPRLRPEARRIVAALKERNIALYILSGDQERPTRVIGEALGIEHCYCNVLPQAKARVIEELQRAGRRVCFVGDGINDAIALKQAQVSVSLSGAATVAVDSAQIVLMDQTLNHLPLLIDISRDLAKNLNTTFTLSVVPGTLIIGGVFVLHFGIPAAMALYSAGLMASLANVMAPLLNAQHGQAENQSARPDSAPCGPLDPPALGCSNSRDRHGE